MQAGQSVKRFDKCEMRNLVCVHVLRMLANIKGRCPINGAASFLYEFRISHYEFRIYFAAMATSFWLRLRNSVISSASMGAALMRARS